MKQVPFSFQTLDLFSYTSLQYMLRAMAAGSAPATFYVDQTENPSVCLIHEGHSLFVGGDAQDPAADEAVAFLTHTILTPEVRQALYVMKIVFENEAWKAKLASAFPGLSVHEYMRSVYLHPAPGSVPAAIAPHIQPITADTAKLENFFMIKDEVESTLGSFEKFLAMGFGCALVMENSVCGFCTAEYISEGECAIGIEVLEKYQKKGYASHMTAFFLMECAHRGLKPYWECWKNNIPSVKTAERAGFKKLSDYPVLFIEFGGV